MGQLTAPRLEGPDREGHMPQLGNNLRFTLTGARVEKAEGLLAWALPQAQDRVFITWTAETRRREAGEHSNVTLAEGEMTGDEVRWWSGWFANAAEVRKLPDTLGDTPSVPVARLWTPLAGAHVEWFVWPEPLGGLGVLALFAPDERSPWERVSVEMTACAEDLAAFGRALEAEYHALLKK
jgi:hypothetical protein